jgi:hypothetical protein
MVVKGIVIGHIDPRGERGVKENEVRNKLVIFVIN